MLRWFSRHPWFFWFLIITLVFISFFPILLKTSVTHGIHSYAKDYGIEKVTLDSISLNPFSGSLTVHDLALYKTKSPQETSDQETTSQETSSTKNEAAIKANEATRVTHINKLDIELKMLDLFKQRLNVEHLIFSDANLPITLDSENQVYLAGIKLSPPKTEDKPKEEKTGLAFEMALKSVKFTDIRLPINIKNTDVNLQIQSLTLSNLESWSEEYARLILHAKINQQDIRSNLQLHLFQQQPEVIGTLKTTGIDLAAFTPLLPQLGFDFKTQFATDMTFTATQTKTGFELFQQGELNFKDSSFKQSQNQLNGENITWKGDAIINQTIDLKDTKLPAIEAKIMGKLNAKKLALQQAGNKANIQNIAWNGDINYQQFTPENEAPAAQKIVINGSLQSNTLNLQQGSKQIKLNSINSQGATQVDIKNNINVALNQVIKAAKFSLQDSTSELNLNSDLQLNTKVKITLAGENINLNHQGTFTANTFAMQQKALKLSVNTLSSRGSAKLALNKTTNIDLQQDIELKQLDLQEDEQQLNLSSDATIKANSQIQLADNTTDVKHQGNIELSNLKATQKALLATLKNLKWQGNVNVNQQQELQLATQGTLALEALGVNNQTINRAVISVDKVNIDDVEMNKKQQITLKNINVNQLDIGDQNLKAKQGLLSALQNLTVNKLEFTPAQTEQQAMEIHLGDITLNGSETFLTLDKNSELLQLNALLASLPIEQENNGTEKKNNEKTADEQVEIETKTDTTAAEKPTPSLIYSVKSVKVNGNNPIFIDAMNVNPPVKKQIALENFSLSGFDSQNPNQSSAYKIKVSFDEFSYLDSKGTVAVLNPSHALKAQTEVESFPLTTLSGLSEGSIGYLLNSGQLSAELNTELNQKKITAKNDVKIHKLELKPGDSDIAKKQQGNFPVPLETGVAMLQDKNGNIKLSIPVKGDIDNPDFNINDVINTALGKAMAGATRTYLLLALQPFGAIALAGEMAINKAGAIDLESITFEPANTDITPKMQQYLAKLSELLKERKAISIKLCEGASQSEKLALKEQLIKTDIEKQSQAGVKDIKVPEINVTDTELLELATERQKQIKRALIQLGVKGKQVIFCTPSIQENTEPKVKLKI